jgi:hypothetical protein
MHRAAHVVEAATGPIRAISIDPVRRSIMAIPIQAVVKPCGCCSEANPIVIGVLIGSRWQQAAGILDHSPCHGGEVLILAAEMRGARWRWGTTWLRGPGLILRMRGAPDAWTFVDSEAAVGNVFECVQWPAQRRRRTMAAAA